MHVFGTSNATFLEKCTLMVGEIGQFPYNNVLKSLLTMSVPTTCFYFKEKKRQNMIGSIQTTNWVTFIKSKVPDIRLKA